MNRSRVTSAVLTCATLLTLTACGGQDAPSTAGSAPPAAASAAPAATTASPAATTASPAATTASPKPSSATAAGAKGDKQLCESARKAGNDMKAAFVTAMQGGAPSPTMLRDILRDFGAELTALGAAGGNSKVAAASKQVGAEAAKAAAATDPTEAAANKTFEKAGEKLTALCLAAGVNLDL